jgi:hypothetical protein
VRRCSRLRVLAVSAQCDLSLFLFSFLTAATTVNTRSPDAFTTMESPFSNTQVGPSHVP